MKRAVTAVMIFVLLFIPTAALGDPAAANRDDGPPEPNWIASLNVGLEAFDWKSDETVTNHINGPAWAGESDDSIRLYLLTFGGEIAGPAIEAVPGRPRIFLGGGIGLPSSTTDQTFSLGQEPSKTNETERDIDSYLFVLENATRPPTPPREFPIPCQDRTPQTCPFPKLLPDENGKADIDGQGSDIRVSFDTVTWFANAGISFDVPVFDTTLVQIRPSIAYRGERVKIESRLTTVTLDELVFDYPPIADFTIHRSRPGAKNNVAHHLGPRLELAAVLSREARPIRTTLFVEGSYLWMLTDHKETQTDPGGIATFTVKRKTHGVRGGVGVRFSWIGWPK